jgi:cullin 3
MVKLKLLTKSTPEFSLSPGDVLALNPDFKSRLMKFKIPLLSAKDQVGKETTKINENLSEDRRHMVEATIVRIMKTRKRLDHNELITEVLKIVSEIFQPSAILIKQRIESLIEKEYLARDN